MAKRSRFELSSKGKKSGETSWKKKKMTNEGRKDTKPNIAASGTDNPESWSKSKKKRMRALRAKLNKGGLDIKKSLIGAKSTSDIASSVALDEKSAVKASRNSKLQESFKARLSGSRFRILNEDLYTTTSEQSFEKFSKNPELFEQYHEGFRHQVESWPVNPVDVIVGWLSSNYRKKTCTVGDFGCGDAQLAKDLLKITEKGKCPFTVHSFDLVSPNELVTACDMANVPLQDKSLDVCIFCLSLMGTNLADFIREAHRVLKDNGRVKIAEVRSRIEYSYSQKGQPKPKNEPSKSTRSEGTLEEFVNVLNELGFDCVRTDRSNKMFLMLELKKSGKKPNKKLTFSAKPCIYKRR